MGRRVTLNLEDFPRSRRGLRFTDAEVSLLANEVKKRKSIIYGNDNTPPQPHQVRRAWEEIAEIVSSLCGIQRNPDQCRKRYNDIKRRGQPVTPVVPRQTERAVSPPKREMRVVLRKRGRPPKKREKVTKTVCPVPESKKNVEPQDLEFEVHAPIEEDPDYEPSPKKRAAVKPVIPEVVTLPVPPSPRAAPSLPKPRSIATDRHPFLELQQAGFDMLQSELSGLRDSITSLESRMSQMEVLLRPIGHIANSLSRIASAVERLTCPPSP
ncbi:myb-related transcription factor, partner of profilin-like [Boleophthalmus pectinirostris]|uniref:myb-related transcription factor, partner of profilin-like n=1 Tax=Boleophthalmus pectinirostris TaxID=150288 RepID=UPI0024326AA2|nr:myb-related transcription factor, partner of profilin-like [Boleophthalmus pectinirostris]